MANSAKQEDAQSLPLLILASPRSGSSLFRILLNQHSRLIVPPECGYIQWLGQKFNGAPLGVRIFVQELQQCKKIEGWNLDYERLESDLAGRFGTKPVDFMKLVDFTHRYFNQEKKAYCWGDKNNYYIHVSEELTSLTSWRVIHLVRDPRGCFSSAKELRTDYKSRYAPELTTDAREFAKQWLEENRRVSRLSEDFDYLRVRYEDVLSCPELELSRIFDWVGVEYEATHETYFAVQHEPSITSEWKEKLSSPLDSSRLSAWRSALSQFDLDEIENELGGVVGEFGYGR